MTFFKSHSPPSVKSAIWTTGRKLTDRTGERLHRQQVGLESLDLGQGSPSFLENPKTVKSVNKSLPGKCLFRNKELLS